MSEDFESRVRARAHAIWVEEGHPDGRADEHWARAVQDVTAADNVAAAEPTAKPVTETAPAPAPVPEPKPRATKKAAAKAPADAAAEPVAAPKKRAPRKAATVKA